MTEKRPSKQIMEDAAQWRSMLFAQNGDAADWEAFTEWLEQSPDHALAYDLVCEAEEALINGLEQQSELKAGSEYPPASNDNSWSKWAVAAALALVVVTSLSFGSTLFSPGQNGELIATAPGEQRQVSLARGLEVTLNGDTRLRQSTDEADNFELVSGEALFVVGPEHSTGITVLVGELTIVDRGTVFNISMGDKAHMIAVSEGIVDVELGGENYALEAGELGRFSAEDGTVEITEFDEATIGSWTEMRLEYSSAGIVQIAQDASRILGVEISSGNCELESPFAGSIQLSGEPAGDVSLIADLLGCRVQSTQGGWAFAE